MQRASLAESAALGAVLAAYQDGGELSNERLYDAVKAPMGFSDDDYHRRDPVGRSGRKHCIAQRQVRWFQQTLKRLNLVERVPGRRGVWRLRGAAEKELTPAPKGICLVGFSTKLGLALWSSCDVFAQINEPVTCVLTSPPYALAKPRRYGNPNEQEIVDFICRSLEPLVKNLVAGGTVVLQTSNDIFVQGSPARSLYIERLTLAVHDRLGLQLHDRVIWNAPCKPPGPVQWASKTRQQLNVGYEFALVFTNDPLRCLADNRRVLLPHTERHKKLIAAGGEKRDSVYGDGAYRLRAGRSFAHETAGRIPKNVLTFTQHGAEISILREEVRSIGLPVHGALMPLELAKFFVRFLTREEDLVVDLFGGWGTTALAAEQCGRRWIVTEQMAEYVAAQAMRLRNAAGFQNSIPLQLAPGLFGG
jgi:site-specific DNA-methyltransferase (cytosine-N4-specific)